MAGNADNVGRCRYELASYQAPQRWPDRQPDEPVEPDLHKVIRRCVHQDGHGGSHWIETPEGKQMEVRNA
jgi:hypothetical protein